ncbi:glycosyltransferase family 4 protein [Desulfococcaceae bacterium HSG7]|nr:glycosyltransferase family 4 protein [Desulfococcaceae bacterium HSG7]
MRIIVLLTDAFGGNGGIALFNRNLLTVLCEHPCCTQVVAIPRLAPRPYNVLPDKLTCITKDIRGKIKYFVTVLQTVMRCRNFDLIICGHIHLIPIAYFLRLWLQRPLLLTIHGIEAWQPSQNKIVNLCIRKIDAFISVSRLSKKRFLKWTHIADKKGFILPNAVAIDKFTPGPKNEILLKRYGLQEKRVLMTLGWLRSNEDKGFDKVIDLLPELSRKIDNLVYIIVGKGDDKSRLMEKVKCLGITDRVIFTGFIPESEKADHYRLADVYVMPSCGEGFGFVFLEAMACGIPVVASKADGSREAVVNGKLGILVDPDNPDDIKTGILNALKRPKGVPEGLEYFSFQNFTQRLHVIVDNVMKTGRNR